MKRWINLGVFTVGLGCLGVGACWLHPAAGLITIGAVLIGIVLIGLKP